MPTGWQTARIRDVFKVVGGGTPSTGVARFWQGDIPWVTSADLESSLRLSPRKFITNEAVEESATNLVPKGSVIVATRVGLGKVGIAERDTCFSQDCQALLPALDLVEPRFVAHQLSVVTREFHHTARGTTISGVTKKQLLDLEFRYPELPVQQRVVAKIEQLFSDLDAGVAALERANANLARYRAVVLKAAVEGKLTEEWRADHSVVEPASALLKQIQAQRRKKWEQGELARHKTRGRKVPKAWAEQYRTPDPLADRPTKALPPAWMWSSIGECFKVVIGATPSRRQPRFWSGSIPWVSSGEVQFSRITSTREQITEEGLVNSSARVNPAGSVMLGMIGEGKTRGQAAILDIDAASNQNCAAIIVPDTPMPSEYVYYWLCSQYEVTRRRASGGNQPALNRTRVERIPIPLPPLEEQRVIVEILECEMSRIETVKTEVKAMASRCGSIRQGVLKRAFSGALDSELATAR